MWETLAKWALTALVGAAAWFGLNLNRRLTRLEQNLVTRDQVDELRHSMMQTFVGGHKSLDEKLDRIIERQMK